MLISPERRAAKMLMCSGRGGFPSFSTLEVSQVAEMLVSPERRAAEVLVCAKRRAAKMLVCSGRRGFPAFHLLETTLEVSQVAEMLVSPERRAAEVLLCAKRAVFLATRLESPSYLSDFLVVNSWGSDLHPTNPESMPLALLTGSSHPPMLLYPFVLVRHLMGLLLAESLRFPRKRGERKNVLDWERSAIAVGIAC